eukprot:TRINITY_DN403_c0_g1_i1.p1 TRINITY_DN403_c0_g1~~TRINITY_DN403_c0_g1_i1.p1  ORF type:complete len:124 (+),score=38.58 TRINITY_DN403_c0_g1_i1:75-446(+)
MAPSMRRPVFAAFLVVTLGQVFAEDEAAVDTEGESQDDTLSGFDADGDGKVTINEVFSSLVDFREDGTDEGVVKAEEKAFLEEKLPEVFKQIDDGDDIVSAEELEILFEALSKEYAQSSMAEL